ncbi:hypothetical protein QUF76_16910 [Desulfobacterales bacterium HSG16]|nr:hypothetical protein [Desulfobacterales bacterium HSG16]
MDNICELLINVVSASKPKTLIGLNQKVRGMVGVLEFDSAQSTIPPVERQILSHLVKSSEHGKPVSLPLGKANRKASLWGCGQRRQEKANVVL